MLELTKTYKGYCAQCNQATIIGELKLHGWDHKFNMCFSCLSTVADTIKRGSPVETQNGK